jgi:hypothetical protein
VKAKHAMLINKMKLLPVVFEEREIRRVYDEKAQTLYFSVVDIIQVLTQQPDFQAARNLLVPRNEAPPCRSCRL